MKWLPKIVPVMLLLIGATAGFSQDFINLNFESANVAGYSPGSSDVVPTSSALPGWAAFYTTASSSNSTSLVSYDVLPLSSVAISIGDTNLSQYGFPPLQGRYSAFLFGANGTSSGIGQTAMVPTDAESLLIEVASVTGVSSGSFLVTLDGQVINMTALQNFSNYTLYGGNVSPFAGRTVPLDLVAPPVSNPLNANGWEFDSISFSPSVVPEPSELALAGLGGLLMGFRRWKNVGR